MDDDHIVRETIAGMITKDSKQKVLIRDNMLIQAVYTSSELETKILLQALYDAQKSQRLSFSYTAEEIAEYLDIPEGNTVYGILQKAVSRLLNNKIIIHDDKKHFTEGFVIVPYCRYNKGVFTIELNHHVMQYLTDLKTSYTSMDIKKLNSFGGQRKSKNFALRLYEILKTKQYLFEKEKIKCVEIYFSLEEIKLRTGLVRSVDDHLEDVIKTFGMTSEALNAAGDIYPEWRDFRRRTLEPAIAQINKTTDLIVSYDTKRKGSNGKVAGIFFYIRKNECCTVQQIESAEKLENAEIQDRLSETERIDIVRSIIGEDVSNSGCMQIWDAAGGNAEKISAAYGLAERQAGEIRNLVSWMVSAIKGGWAENTSSAAAGTRTGNFSGRKSFSRMDHEGRFGFGANDYDFDVLEEELLARGYEQCGGYEKHGDGA